MRQGSSRLTKSQSFSKREGAVLGNLFRVWSSRGSVTPSVGCPGAEAMIASLWIAVAAAKAEPPVRLILDTDMGGGACRDVDDVVALCTLQQWKISQHTHTHQCFRVIVRAQQWVSLLFRRGDGACELCI